MRYPRKTSTKKNCDTIAESIARYEKYRCWALLACRVRKLLGAPICGFFSEEFPQNNVRKKKTPPLLKKVSQYTSKLYCGTPPICIAVLLVPLRTEEREILSVLLPFVSQYASHLYCNTSPICIAVLLGKSWWLWSPGCSFPIPARKGCSVKKMGASFKITFTPNHANLGFFLVILLGVSRGSGGL